MNGWVVGFRMGGACRAKWLRALLAWGLGCWIALGAAIAGEMPGKDEVLGAAKGAVAKFTKMLDSAEMRETHGFARDDDFSQLAYGTPFVQRLLRQDVLDKDQTEDLSKLLIDTTEWFVPVLSKGKIACLVTVSRKGDGQWQEGRMGMPELARAWQAVAEAWPEEKGYHPALVIHPARQQFFYQVPEAKPANLTRLDIHAADAGSVEARRKLTPAARTLAALRS